MNYVIRNDDRASVNRGLLWSTELGWVERASATVFAHDEMDLDLPSGGVWTEGGAAPWFEEFLAEVEDGGIVEAPLAAGRRAFLTRVLGDQADSSGYPCVALVVLSAQQAGEIVARCERVRGMGAVHAAWFDAIAQFFGTSFAAGQDGEMRVDCPTMVCQGAGVKWSAYLRHCDCARAFSSEIIPLERLRAVTG